MLKLLLDHCNKFVAPANMENWFPKFYLQNKMMPEIHTSDIKLLVNYVTAALRSQNVEVMKIKVCDQF